jgi:hypothetical protein
MYQISEPLKKIVQSSTLLKKVLTTIYFNRIAQIFSHFHFPNLRLLFGNLFITLWFLKPNIIALCAEIHKMIQTDTI